MPDEGTSSPEPVVLNVKPGRKRKATSTAVRGQSAEEQGNLLKKGMAAFKLYAERPRRQHSGENDFDDFDEPPKPKKPKTLLQRLAEGMAKGRSGSKCTSKTDKVQHGLKTKKDIKSGLKKQGDLQSGLKKGGRVQSGLKKGVDLQTGLKSGLKRGSKKGGSVQSGLKKQSVQRKGKLQTGLASKKKVAVKSNATTRSRKKSVKNQPTKNVKFEISEANIDGGRGCRRRSRPNKIVEGDPILDHFKDTKQQDIDELCAEDGSDEQKKKIKTDVVETKEGQIEIQTYSIRKPKKRDRTVKYTNCDASFKTQQEFNRHHSQEHNDVPFTCDLCGKTFKSPNSVTKHRKKYFLFQYVCDICQKRFQFPANQQAHKTTHTGLHRIPCLFPKCTKTFATKFGMEQHRKGHFNDSKKFTCEVCDNKVFASILSFRQHMKGLHRSGYVTECGQAFRWPDQKNKHVNNCEECQEAKVKRDNSSKPKPEPFTKRRPKSGSKKHANPSHIVGRIHRRLTCDLMPFNLDNACSPAK